MKKKVAIFTADSNGAYPVPASKDGAVSTLIEHFIEENSKQGKVDFEVISYYDAEAEKISKKYKNVNFVWIKIPRFIKWLDALVFYFIKTFFKEKKALSYKSLFSLAYYILKSVSILKMNKYDKVVLENNIPLAWIIKLSKYKGEYYYHFHNIPRINAGCKSVFENCKSIICVSKFVGEQICLETNPIGPISTTKIKVLYNCVDTKKFYAISNEEQRRKIREIYGIKDDECVILFVGRLSAEKGIDKLLEAVNKLKNKKVKVLIVGSYMHSQKIRDGYQEKLVKLAEKMQDNIIFSGYIPQSELAKIYNIANVAVLPSIWDEPAGLTMIESLACGVPVITTNSGGIPEYVSNCGIVLERNDELIDNIALNIEKIIEHKIDINTLSKNGISRINENFGMKKYLENFVKIIED